MNFEQKFLIDRVVDKYLKSRDFNGLPVLSVGKDNIQNQSFVSELISERHLDLVRGDIHPNPHIKALKEESSITQVEKIRERGLGHGCLYPSKETLIQRETGKSFEDQPFARELAIGAAQLSFAVFDLRLLEWYRNDPKFAYDVDDIHGRIYLQDGQENRNDLRALDEVELFRFGFAYDEQLNRGVAVFLRDLCKLPSQQQLLLETFKIDGSFQLHPDFHRRNITGDWPKGISVYDAFLEEKNQINKICDLLRKPALFKSNYCAHNRPTGFGVLLRSTRKEYREFTLLLDQLMSDDLSRKFFKGEIRTSEILTNSDGIEKELPIGTIRLLQSWLNKQDRLSADNELIIELAGAFRKVRKARQRPAHRQENNDFDQKYLAEQRILMENAFFAIRSLRTILSSLPNASTFETQIWLEEADIWLI